MKESHSNHPDEPLRPRVSFATTKWTQVVQAQGQTEGAQEALSELCSVYYAPVEAFIRKRTGRERSRDLTQAFFARLLEKGGVSSAQPYKGRFRSFLLGAVKHFLADQKDYERAAKRGGGEAPLSLDAEGREGVGLEVADESMTSSEGCYDRRWAITLLDRGLARVREELEVAGKAEQFEILKHWLPGSSGIPQAEAIARLGISEGAFKVAVHRLRKRFRDAVRAEVAATVESSEQIREEVRYLIEVMARGHSD